MPQPFTPGRSPIYAGQVNMYWSALGVKLPGVDVPFNASAGQTSLWPAGWNLIYDVTQALGVQPRNPQDSIFGEFHDLLAEIPAGSGGGGGGRGRGGGGGGGGRGGGAGGASGGAGVSIAFEILTPEVQLWQNLNSFAKTVAAAQAAQRSLTITSAATAGGNVLVTLNGATPVSIPILSSDTTAGIATKIAAGVYAGWSAVAVGSTVTFTAAATGLKQGTFSVSGPTGFAGTFATVAPGHFGLTSFYVDHTKTFPIQFGFEMIPLSGVVGSHFWPQQNLRRGFAFQAVNTAAVEDIWGKTGTASLLTPNVQLECLPTTVDPTLVAGTGMENMVDINGRFFYLDIPLTDPSL